MLSFSSSLRSSNDVFVLLLLFASSVNAYFLDPLLQFGHNNGEFELSRRGLAPRSLEHSTTLRVLSVGASITYGLHSPDGNGYRYALRGKLIEDGNDVNMIGPVQSGNMSNNEVAGFPGMKIDIVAQKVAKTLPQLPNVVLMLVGTNDMDQNFNVSTAHLRIGKFVDYIFEKVPNTTIIVSTLLPNADPKTEENTLFFNEHLVPVIANRSAAGQKVSLVDLHSDWFSLADIGPDGTHPTEMGYLKVARVFYNGIVAAAAAGNITRPAAVADVDDYKAGNDSSAAGTAMNVVCQQVKGQVLSDAQAQQCSASVRLQILNIPLVLVVVAAMTYVL